MQRVASGSHTQVILQLCIIQYEASHLTIRYEAQNYVYSNKQLKAINTSNTRSKYDVD